MTTIRRYVQRVAGSDSEAALLERIALYLVLGYRDKDIYRYLRDDDGYDISWEEFRQCLDKLHTLQAAVGAEVLQDEVSSYLLSMTYLEERINDILQTMLNNYARLMAGQLYDEDGNRIPPIQAKDIVNVTGVLQKLKASKIGLLRDMLSKPKSATVTALPEKSEVVVEADFVDVLEVEDVEK